MEVKLSIPTPCHENWQEMTPNEQGRFCASCQKTVMDFTGWTDKELVEFLAKGGQHTCGRFSNMQLNSELTTTTFHRKPWLQTLLTLSIAYFTVKPAIVIAQTKPDSTYSNVAGANITSSVASGEAQLSQSAVKGIIVDEHNKEPIIGAVVQLLNDQHHLVAGAVTDIDGYFLIPNLKPGRYKLVGIFMLYERKESDFFNVVEKDTITVNMVLKERIADLTMGAIVTTYSPRYWRRHPWQFIKRKIFKINPL